MDNETRKRKLSQAMDIPIQSKRQFRASVRDGKNKTSVQQQTAKSIQTFDPRGINVLEFAEARALEIKNLQIALNEAKLGCNSTPVQRLPRHMRRRAGNHDIKRLPKRIRPNKDDSKKNSGNKDKSKKNRKQRRKPKLLFEEYKKRQDGGYKWLETHIWHAKRFYIKEKWGYKVAENTFAKAVRSSYRSVKNSCLLQDVSYFEIVQLTGRQQDIQDCLRHLSPNSDVSSFNCSDQYFNLMCYKSECYPFGAIGPVKILWATPASSVADEWRKLVLVIHPSVTQDIMHEIQQNNTINERELIVQKYSLDFVMFSLTGKQSASMLANVLRPHESKAESVVTSKDTTEESAPPLMNTMEEIAIPLSNTTAKEDDLFLQKKIMVAKMNNNVLNFCVKDPRFYLPKKKKNPLQGHEEIRRDEKECVSSSNHIEYSDIWDDTKRKVCSESKKSDAEINQMREKFLCQMEELPFESPEIPVCLLRTPGTELSNGYQMILPANWAMPFWISLIYEGARAGGLQEEVNVCFEAGSLHFPMTFPDTKAGSKEAVAIATTKQEKYQRIPPAKRISYDHLGILYPYALPWLELVLQWRFNLNDLLKSNHLFKNQNNNAFYVLRDLKHLHKFSAMLKSSPDVVDIEDVTRFENALIPVRIQALCTGIPEDNALLCIPDSNDHAELVESKRDEFSEYSGPVEPQHKGLKQHFPFVYKKHDLALHNTRLIGRNTRWIVGFVSKGNYSFVSGKGGGVCFVSALGLYYHLRTVANGCPKNLLLFRNTNTLHYRYCTIDVIV